ncbi:MAG TPA: thymidine phosphorylase [Acidimicrobiia bacterium]|nr:thymidine phosphorylase [Acidimicrobiia bacterium]
MSYTAVELIETKRDGGTLSADSIEWLIRSYTDGSVTDYQMSAMAMAIYFKGMDADELSTWTRAMLVSGDVLDFSDIKAPKVDKHSTGGVGDKISIPLAPLVASCGVAVPMISGRSLGHTGGTLDKLETIPGFTTDLDRVTFRRQLGWHGLVLAGQSDTLAPADKKLYSLRDATGTVPSIPLIASSIMSKKLAEGLNGLVLDVKTGLGAQMRALEDSKRLAEIMVGIGNANRVRTVALITDMSQPLGMEVGNANEIRESISVLKGEGPPDVTTLTMALGEVMLELAGVDGGRDLLQSKIDSGEAFRKFKEVAVAQDGDPAVIDDPSLLPQGRYEASLPSPRSGYVQVCDALRIGTVVTRLGAGRVSMGDNIDPGVGVTVHKKVGDIVAAGDNLATVVHNDSRLWGEQREALFAAWTVGDERVAPPQLIVERIE